MEMSAGFSISTCYSFSSSYLCVSWYAKFLPPITPPMADLSPESPRFLVKKRKYHEAYRSLLALREVPLLAARDLFYMHVQLLAETKIFSVNPDIELVPVSSDPGSDSDSINRNLDGIGRNEIYQD